ncbi:DNA-binding MarR family transcriptional regulator [Motilibacter rhizosphaerae]|uniref:DNA-binding MarR family transcriptional regulator n=1 Tax=Motilibacter rhizosphaerae TaxID=598652 RepID=A0A4Q7NWV8_9ACTN|nr:MarR family winged helix-turn-helix transcriptional regulator [Motilibacter rhizosphaerae]RZS91821.1 DNA-binding MarR family transcriptional regulator [Motilibacter rhizosphaerae]
MPHDLSALPTWILSAAASRSHQVIQQRLAQAGVNGYQYRCLTALAAAAQLSQTELGAAASLDGRDVTHTVRALEDRGLVLRVKDPSHGRRQLVSLSPEGREVADALGRVMAEVQEEVFHGLSRDERSTLLRLLERVARA